MKLSFTPLIKKNDERNTHLLENVTGVLYKNFNLLQHYHELKKGMQNVISKTENVILLLKT